jgi:pimeloyl-ACP methyl ester carboxylesterase
MMDWIEVNDTSLRFELTGQGEKVLVLVHEMGGTLDSWDQVMPTLLPGRKILRFDWRGAGMSEKLRTTPTFDLLADDIAELLDALGITQKVALAGCAVGAGITLAFALRHGARTSGVVAMGPATGVDADRRDATLARADSVEKVGPRGIVDQSFAASYPPVVQHDAEQFRKFRARWLANDPESFAAINRMLADSPLTKQLAGIACPVLLLAGTHDPLRPPSVIEPLAARLPNARFKALETGHFMAVQTPEIVAETIKDFLAEVGA